MKIAEEIKRLGFSMTAALQWFVFIFSGYMIMMLLWAYQQSRRSSFLKQGEAFSAQISTWKYYSLQFFFLLGSGAFIVMPAMVFQYGLWGLVWLGLILMILLVSWLLSPLFDKKPLSFLKAFFQFQILQTLKTGIMVLGVILLLIWQLKTATDIINALGFVPLVKTIFVLGFVLFLLVSVSLAGDSILSYLSGLKLLILMLCCVAVAFVLYVYIGGYEKFFQHISQFYKFSDTSLAGMLSVGLHIPKASLLRVELSSFLALGFSFIILLVMAELSREMSALSLQKQDNEGGGIFYKLMTVFVLGSLLLIFVAYLLLLGFGAHFTGADSDYNQSYGSQVSVLFEPIDMSLQFPNLMASFVQNLAPIIPLVTAIFTVLMLIVLLSTSQILLHQSGRLINQNILIPALNLVKGGYSQDRIANNIRQRRSYAVVLMVVMLVSQW